MAEYLKIPEVAHRLDVSEKTVRRYIKSGTLPSVFIGGAYRVSEEDLQEFLESARVEPGKALASTSLQPTFNDVLAEERRSEFSDLLRALFYPEDLDEVDIATLLQLNKELTDNAEEIDEASAEETKQCLIAEIRRRLEATTHAINRKGPFTETEASKRRRAERQVDTETDAAANAG